MVLPNFPAPQMSREEIDQTILRTVLKHLSEETVDLRKYRDYYDGEQKLSFGTDKFREQFGDAFEGFRDNWCGVVVDAVLDRLSIEGFEFEEEEAGPNGDDIWRVFRENLINEQQKDLTEGALVEGRSAMIVWPDDELGVRIDWQPAEIVKVEYSEEDWRKPRLAVKRWRAPSGDVYVNVYTPEVVYKYLDLRETQEDSVRGPRGLVPSSSARQTGFQRREVPGEPWPLPNPFGEVPVIEFVNKRGSELSDVIPQQDAVNYMLIAGFTAAEFQAFRQRAIFTGAHAPDGGWSNEPGKVWGIPPMIDADGKPHFGSAFEFGQVSLGDYRSFVEMMLQHTALTSKTPVRMFFQSDRGGRGDAPSGESLLVDDEPLLDKIEDRQERFGNSWYQVAGLVAKGLLLRDDGSIDGYRPPLGTTVWKDPRARYRTSLVDEAVKLSSIGVPIEFLVGHLGFSEDEQEILLEMIEKEKEEQRQREEEQMALQRQSIENSANSPSGNPTE